METTPTKSDLWKVLKGECTMPEVLKIFGRSQDEINEAMGSISTDAFKLHSYSITFKRIAYLNLIDMGDIDKDKIFNIGNNNDEPCRKGDFGFMRNKTFRHNGNSWELLNPSLKNNDE